MAKFTITTILVLMFTSLSFSAPIATTSSQGESSSRDFPEELHGNLNIPYLSSYYLLKNEDHNEGYVTFNAEIKNIEGYNFTFKDSDLRTEIWKDTWDQSHKFNVSVRFEFRITDSIGPNPDYQQTSSLEFQDTEIWANSRVENSYYWEEGENHEWQRVYTNDFKVNAYVSIEEAMFTEANINQRIDRWYLEDDEVGEELLVVEFTAQGHLPEPATLFLIASGALFTIRRRRNF